MKKPTENMAEKYFELLHSLTTTNPRSFYTLLYGFLSLFFLYFPEYVNAAYLKISGNLSITISLGLAPVAITSMFIALGNSIRSTGKDMSCQKTVSKGAKILNLTKDLARNAAYMATAVVVVNLSAELPDLTALMGQITVGELIYMLPFLVGGALLAIGVAEFTGAVVLICIVMWLEPDCLEESHYSEEE